MSTMLQAMANGAACLGSNNEIKPARMGQGSVCPQDFHDPPAFQFLLERAHLVVNFAPYGGVANIGV